MARSVADRLLDIVPSMVAADITLKVVDRAFKPRKRGGVQLMKKRKKRRKRRG